MNILALKTKIQNRELSAVEATQMALQRIQEVDSIYKSYITVDGKQAIAQATCVQEAIDKKELVNPLAGIPVAIKDNICTKGLYTTCGSKMLEHFIPPYNAQVVERLQQAGAIIIGKTNMDEFAMGSTTETSAFGITKNPWNLEYVPGGSSGGSATAVALGECVYALGSDTGGSVRQPSAFCGLVGMKPTYGTVSRYGLISYASSLEQIGPMCQTVADCAMVLEGIASYDPKDSTSVKRNGYQFTNALVNDVKGIKIGIPKEYFEKGLEESRKVAILKAAKELEKQGAIVEEFQLGFVEYAVPAYYVIAMAEASSNLARFDGVKYGYRAKQYEGFHDLYRKSRSEAFGQEVKRRILLGSFVLSAGYYDAYYKRALHTKELIKREFQKAFTKFDVILAPVSPSGPAKIGTNLEKICLEDRYTVSANLAGLPAMTVPCGRDKNNIPIGMQLIGNHFMEETLIRTAYTFENIGCAKESFIK